MSSRNPFRQPSFNQSQHVADQSASTPPIPTPVGLLSGSSHFIINGGQFNEYQNIYPVAPSDANFELGLKTLYKASSPDAAFNSHARDPPPRCDPGTRVQVMQRLTDWVSDPLATQRIAWLYSPMFEGKSSIAQSLAEYFADADLLGASFFFRADRESRSKGGRVFPTIAYQLASAIPEIRALVDKAVREDPTIVDQSLDIQLEKLILDPIRNSDLGRANSSNIRIVILDGINHCDGVDVQHSLIRLVCRASQCPPLRFLVTMQPPTDPTISLTLHNCNDGRVHNHIRLDIEYPSHDDIRLVLRKRLSEVYHGSRKSEFTRARIPQPWPSPSDLEILLQKAHPYFVNAKYICEQIQSSPMSPWDTLTHFLNMSQLELQGLTYESYRKKMGSRAFPPGETFTQGYTTNMTQAARDIGLGQGTLPANSNLAMYYMLRANRLATYSPFRNNFGFR